VLAIRPSGSAPGRRTFMLRPLVPLLRPLTLPLPRPSASAYVFFCPEMGVWGFEFYVCVCIVVLSFLGGLWRGQKELTWLGRTPV
jgi:hypothetical protein